MAERAHVRSVDALRRLRAELLLFREDVSRAMNSGVSDVERTLEWLQNVAIPRWSTEVRVRTEELGRAKSALFREQAFRNEWGSGSVDARKAVERAKRRLEEAEAKIEASRRWARTLDNEATLFRGQMQALATALAGIPRASGTLKGAIESLEAYLALKAPGAAGPDGADDESNEGERESIARRGGADADREHRDDQRRHGPPEGGLGPDAAGMDGSERS